MKLILAIALLFAGAAQATGTPVPPAPVPTPVSSHAQSQATSQAKAAAMAGAAAKASAAGGSATGGQAAGGMATGTGGSNSLGDSNTSLTGDSSDYNAWSVVLPPLASTPPMAPIAGCAPEITQSAVGFVFGIFSDARARTDPSDCTLIALRNTKFEQCQFASAKQIEDLMLLKKLPDFKPSAAVFIDHDQAMCAAIRNPPTTPAPPPPKPEVVYETHYRYFDAPGVPDPPKPAKPKPKKPCPTGQQLVCKAKE